MDYEARCKAQMKPFSYGLSGKGFRLLWIFEIHQGKSRRPRLPWVRPPAAPSLRTQCLTARRSTKALFQFPVFPLADNASESKTRA